MHFTDAEKKILRHVQGNLPADLMPFAEIASKCGVSEEFVLQFLQSLADQGMIRRFGASIRHQNAGWNENAMVAWIATRGQADRLAPQAAANGRISHIYFRPSPGPHWPYTLYTMIHGLDARDCENTLASLAEAWKLPYAVLRSIRELKKTSPSYF